MHKFLITVGAMLAFAAPALAQTVTTERGAHTTAFDPDRHKIYALLPRTHRAAVYIDRE